MKEKHLNPNDAALSELLREARSTHALPARFQENVWRQIQRAEEASTPATRPGWLDAVAGWILRPRPAFALAAILILTGAGLGWNSGGQVARHDAQARYLATVAPSAIH